MLDGDADGAVQLVGDGGHRGDGAPDGNLGDRYRVLGPGTGEPVIGHRRGGQICCGPGLFDLSRHGGQRVLNGLELAERAAELYPLASVGDGQLQRGIEGADDLHAARPRTPAHQFVTDGRIQPDQPVGSVCQGAPRLTGQVVSDGDLGVVEQTDIQPVRFTGGQHDRGVRRPRHLAGGTGGADRHRERTGRNLAPRLAGQPARQQIGLGDRHGGAVAGQPGQHDRGFTRPGVLFGGEPGQPGLLERAPQVGVEDLR
ncbi:MAG: hypothetical protein K0R33_1682 [Mycobacterium sp.]|nr:hypothetical protein [Mycobacterium sp.]